MLIVPIRFLQSLSVYTGAIYNYLCGTNNDN